MIKVVCIQLISSLLYGGYAVIVIRLMRFGYLLSTYLTLLLNVANYRKEEGQWKLLRLLKKVHHSEVIKYTLNK
ncbi:hypothetical protein [Paenibacillus polymyxa]|uniref:hypothetical protein n=1 Tax=Paenibacillus polymyxa TaxID=1406 RepID=UPI0004DF69E4|nr:hypothetical protein [Paenibacillus polymyxa]MBE3650828.1 hypothetical protein [Paenibacillus polymyxa]RPE03386.1 hypothetical protein EG487_14490 [Paenibacillus polymyxa]